MLAAVGGAAILRVVLLLVVLAPTGPGGYWFGFWTDPLARTAYIAVAFAAFGWVLVAGAWALATQVGAMPRPWRGGRGGGSRARGVRRPHRPDRPRGGPTAWNDEMGLLPWGLSRILGISVYLDIPADTAWWAAIAGLVLVVVGAILVVVGGLGRRSRTRAAGSPA